MSIASELNCETIVDIIADVFHRRGADSYLGEEVTMSQHMLQGAYIAEQLGADDDMVAAVLLHDIGHYSDEFPEDALERGIDNHHEDTGAALLAPYFPAVVVDCVRHHVAAKRYLCATNSDYFARLSEASVHSLNLQGGPMTDAEVAVFSKQVNLDAILQVRMWDDAGKIAGGDTRPFEHYLPLLYRLVETHRTSAH